MKSTKKQIEINKPSDDGYRWIENINTGWRFVDYADKIANLHHRGWYTDAEFQDEILRGVVYRLPSRKSGPVYFVGYADPNNDDAARGEIRTDLSDDIDAANAADDIAKQCAESENEYQEVWRLGQSYADTFDTVESERQTRRELFAELKTLRSISDQIETPTICKTIKSKIISTRRNIKSALKERREILRDNYVRGQLLDAFAEGASLTLSEAKELF